MSAKGEINITKVKHIGFIFQGSSDSITEIAGIPNEVYQFQEHIFNLIMKKYPEYTYGIICHYVDEISLARRCWGQIDIWYSYDARDYEDIYKKFDLVVGCRMHGIGIAASLGIPGIPVLHDFRKGTYKGFVINENVVPLSVGTMDDDVLADIEYCLSNIKSLSSELKNHKKMILNRYQEVFKNKIIPYIGTKINYANRIWGGTKTKPVERLKEYCKEHKRVFLYGAGLWGKTLYSILQKNKIEIAGYITTNGGPDFNYIKNYKAVDILPTLHFDDGIVIAMDELKRNSVLDENVFPSELLLFSEMEFREMEADLYYDPSEYAENNIYLKKAINDLDWKRILIVQLEVTYGDMIWSTAFVRELRRNFPNAYISFVMNPKYRELYDTCPYIDDIKEFDCSNVTKCKPNEIKDNVNAYVQEELTEIYDAVFLPRLLPCGFSDSWENVLVAMAVKTRYRFGHTWELLPEFQFTRKLLEEQFTCIVSHEEAAHEAQNDLQLIQAFDGTIEDVRMELWPTKEDIHFAEEALQNYKGKYLVTVALVGSHPRRSWDAKKYARVFKEVENRICDNVIFVLCGGNDAKPAARIVQEILGEKCINLTGATTLRQAEGVISKSCLYIGSDTGLMHIASAFGVPIIELTASLPDSPDYWGSSPTRTGPWQVPSCVIRPSKGLDGCRYICQSDKAHCICQIKEEEVTFAILKMLDGMKDKK